MTKKKTWMEKRLKTDSDRARLRLAAWGLQPIMDLVFQWSDTPVTDPRPLVAGISPEGALLLCLRKEAERLVVSVPIDAGPVPTQAGPKRQFRLIQIWPHVLKLNQSVLDEKLHAFVTIVGVPFVAEPVRPLVEEMLTYPKDGIPEGVLDPRGP